MMECGMPKTKCLHEKLVCVGIGLVISQWTYYFARRKSCVVWTEGQLFYFKSSLLQFEVEGLH